MGEQEMELENGLQKDAEAGLTDKPDYEAAAVQTEMEAVMTELNGVIAEMKKMLEELGEAVKAVGEAPGTADGTPKAASPTGNRLGFKIGSDAESKKEGHSAISKIFGNI